MPRKKRQYVPKHVFHITHRCHDKRFLLKYKKDRVRYRYWLYEARKRYGLSVLNYMITSNHVHLLIQDTGHGEISLSMQLIAGRVAQEYNRRKSRYGAYWDSRYHVTAVEADSHLLNCFIYIDLNMVRAGVVSHPCFWSNCGYQDIHNERLRYKVIDYTAVLSLFGSDSIEEFRQKHHVMISEVIHQGALYREPHWSEQRAVGSEEFIQLFA